VLKQAINPLGSEAIDVHKCEEGGVFGMHGEWLLRVNKQLLMRV
jgi:hypothetical protein